MPEIKTLKQTTCLEIELNNGAKYSLPFKSVQWEAQPLPSEFNVTIDFKLKDLMLCTLKNLIKPELQCIYIDDKGGVSCDFMSACIDKGVVSTIPFLLPADAQELVDGKVCKVAIEENRLAILSDSFFIATSKPAL